MSNTTASAENETATTSSTKGKRKKKNADKPPPIPRSLPTQVDVIAVPELVSAFTTMKRTTQEMVDCTYIAKLLPESDESYLVDRYQMPPPSDSVVLAFTAVGVGYLIQDNNSIRNSYPTNVYVALQSALQEKVGGKRRTRTMLRQKMTTWVTENFTSDMFAADSGNMVVVYEKSGSNYFMAVKPGYNDDSYAYVVSSKMDIGHAMVPFFRNQDVKDVLFGCFDSDILPHIEHLLTDMVDFMIRTKVGAEEIYTIFARVFTNCTWYERNTALSTPPFTLPDLFDKTRAGNYYYAEVHHDDSLHVRVIGDALRRSVREGEGDRPFGLLPVVNGTVPCPTVADVDDRESALVYTTTLHLVMTIIEMAMRIPCRRPAKDSSRGDSLAERGAGGASGGSVGANNQHVPRVYILFWSDDPEDVVQLRNCILVLARYHAAIAGRVGRNNYLNYMIKKSITYSNHNISMPSPAKQPFGVHSQWFLSSASNPPQPAASCPSSPAPTGAVDGANGAVVPFLNANAPNPQTRKRAKPASPRVCSVSVHSSAHVERQAKRHQPVKHHHRQVRGHQVRDADRSHRQHSQHSRV